MVTIGGQRVSLPAGSIVKLRTNTDCSGTVTIRSGNLLAFGVTDATLFVNGAQAGTGVSGDCYVAGPANTRANLSFGIIPVMGDIRQMVVDGQETQRGPQNSRIDLSLDTTDIRGDLTLVGYPAFYEGKVDTFSYSSALIADFAVGPPNEGKAPFNVSFRDLSAGTRANDTTWSWDFGDGSTSAEQNPVHQYPEPRLLPDQSHGSQWRPDGFTDRAERSYRHPAGHSRRFQCNSAVRTCPADREVNGFLYRFTVDLELERGTGSSGNRQHDHRQCGKHHQ